MAKDEKVLMKYLVKFIELIQAGLIGMLSELGVLLNWIPTMRAFVLITAAALMFVFTGYIKETYGLNGTVQSAIDKINSSTADTASILGEQLQANAEAAAAKLLLASQEAARLSCIEATRIANTTPTK